MNVRSLYAVIGAGLMGLACAGCMKAPGKPGVEEGARPEQVVDFATLYKQNCAACHGENGRGGAAIALANPVYLMTAGAENLRNVTANGVAGSLMPGFAKKAGGMLTDQQVAALVQGMMSGWGGAGSLAGAPGYAASGKGDAAKGMTAYGTFCARCHGADGSGVPGKMGSIVEPAYLALISDEGLRSIVIAGRPDLGMPDWRGDGARAMTDQEVTDIVAWLAGQRTATPGGFYAQHP